MDEPMTTPSQPSISDEDSDEPERRLPLDVTFEILKNRRRRLVLKYLRDAGESTTIGELAEHIAAIENDTTVQQLNAQQRKRVYIGLYQCHLPKMDDAGVVEFNQGRGRIELSEDARQLYRYIDTDDEDEPDEGDAATFRSAYAGGYVAFAALFLVAQLSSAHAVANALVVAFLVVVLAASVLSRPES